jgi:hypothetical protein
MAELNYDLETLNRRDYSYPNQLRDMEREGWEIDPTMQAGDKVYLRRHQRVAELQHLVNLKRKYLRFEREGNGTWIAKFVPAVAAAGSEVFRGDSALESAEAAWQWMQAQY